MNKVKIKKYFVLLARRSFSGLLDLAVVLSVVMLLIDAALIVAARFVDPFLGMGLVFFSPLTLMSIICLIYLTRPKIKALFSNLKED